jgi:hypothetical protein
MENKSKKSILRLIENRRRSLVLPVGVMGRTWRNVTNIKVMTPM